ncbi:MAG: acyl-CoA reductase [Flavobacteriaceae bacterium]
MNQLKDRIKSIERLGHYLRHISKENSSYTPFFDAIKKAELQNGWFKEEDCLLAIRSWGNALLPEKISQWVNPYQFEENTDSKTIALIMAGNIPLVGLHDLISIWISGHKALVKCASKDSILIPFIVGTDPLLKSLTAFTDEKLKGFDAVIATGSNNAARYFDHYFSKFPHIIRKNKNAVAVLDGTESTADLEGLGKDILQYYGLGCRNVSKLYLPKEYDLNQIFGGLYPHAKIIQMNKYANNYDYNKAVYLMSEFDFLENGFFMLKEGKDLSSPIATANYEYYDLLKPLEKHLENEQDNIQCIVSNLKLPGAVRFGEAQNPELWDYADGVDTLDFLKSL